MEAPLGLLIAFLSAGLGPIQAVKLQALGGRTLSDHQLQPHWGLVQLEAALQLQPLNGQRLAQLLELLQGEDQEASGGEHHLAAQGVVGQVGLSIRPEHDLEALLPATGKVEPPQLPVVILEGADPAKSLPVRAARSAVDPRI